MFCASCGNQVPDNTVICPRCGRNAQAQPQAAYQQPVNPSDTGSIGYGILGFLWPLIGLILFLVWKSTAPRNAKSAGKGALIGVIVYVVGSIVFAVIYVLIIMQAVGGI